MYLTSLSIPHGYICTAASQCGRGDGAQDLTTIGILVVRTCTVQLDELLHQKIVLYKTYADTGMAFRQYESGCGL